MSKLGSLEAGSSCLISKGHQFKMTIKLDCQSIACIFSNITGDQDGLFIFPGDHQHGN